ncbi:MAG: hypothetical protein IKX45_08805 [Bacteroidales bacterium]|nr:hypothetical protein [Bacteroidales bacterium]
MKKSIIITSILAIALCGCTVEDPIGNNTEEGISLEVKASLPNSKVTYTTDGNTPEGFTTAFSNTDRIFLWFKGNQTKHNKLTIQEGFTPTSATFRVASAAVDPTSMAGEELQFGAFLTGALTYDAQSAPRKAAYRFSESNTQNFKNGLWFGYTDGTAASANAANVLFAHGTYSDGLPTLSFQYLTSVVKLVLTLPDGAGATESNTEINIEGTKVYDYLYPNVVTGECRTDSGYTATEYGIQIVPDASCFGVGGTITAYACMWTGASGITIQNATVDVVVDGTKHYEFSIADGTGVKLDPGNVYTLTKTTSLAKFNKWVNDDAGSTSVAAGVGSATAGTGDWLSYTDGTLEWTENTTGSPRYAEMTVNGKTIIITQLDEKDFAGDWLVNADGGYIRATTAASKSVALGASTVKKAYQANPGGTNTSYYYDADWTAPGAGQNESNVPLSITYTGEDVHSANDYLATATDLVSLSKPNNLRITGFYQNMTMDAKAEVDYTNQDASLYLALDIRAAQLQTISGGTYDGEYAGFMPELKNGSNWDLGYASIGANNYQYYYGAVTIGSTGTEVVFSPGQKLYQTNGTQNGSLTIVGFLVNRYHSKSVATAELIRSTKSIYTSLGYSAAAYAKVYQNQFKMTK